MTAIFRRWLLRGGSVIITTAAFAHDPTASQTTARVHRDWIGMETKIAAETAWSVVQQENSLATFQRETFETTVQPVLVAWAAASLHRLEIKGHRIEPRAVEVVLIEDNLIFRLSYPRPTSRLRITMPFLDHVDPTYVAHLAILDDAGHPLLEKAETQADPVAQLDLPSVQASSLRMKLATWWSSMWAGVGRDAR